MLVLADEATTFCRGRYGFDLYVKGRMPAALEGSLLVPLSRRHKDRSRHLRWHDSQTDLLRLDLTPGRPGSVRAEFMAVDPDVGNDPGRPRRGGYLTQPNHGVNVAGGRMWATNLLYGAPLQVEIGTLTPEAAVDAMPDSDDGARLVSTAHFAFDLDNRYAYFAQSLLHRSDEGSARESNLALVEIDVTTGSTRTWALTPPPTDHGHNASNFHSCFFWEEGGERHVGLLRTGVVIDCLEPTVELAERGRSRMPASTIWGVTLDDEARALQAELLPGVAELDGMALSHLDVDNGGGDGFVLYANTKEADVGKETIGVNCYGEDPTQVLEHYSGMIVEAMAPGKVIRYEHRPGRPPDIRCLDRHYDHGESARGHTWLPINIDLDRSGEHLFCTFSGLKPRLVSRYVADLYPDRAVDVRGVRYVPPALMRLDATTLTTDDESPWSSLSYTEPVASAVVGTVGSDGYICTFSPEKGLRIYRADDLSRMVCLAESMDMRYWDDEWFRTDPAHLMFVPR